MRAMKYKCGWCGKVDENIHSSWHDIRTGWQNCASSEDKVHDWQPIADDIELSLLVELATAIEARDTNSIGSI